MSSLALNPKQLGVWVGGLGEVIGFLVASGDNPPGDVVRTVEVKVDELQVLPASVLEGLEGSSRSC